MTDGSRESVAPGTPPDEDESQPPRCPSSQGGTDRSSAEDVGLEPVPPWDRQLDRRAFALLVLFVWLAYLITATYDSFQINDNRAVNISAWSLGTRGTLELPASWEGHNRWIIEGRDGALYTNRFPGAILWAAPFHAVAGLVAGTGTPDHAVFINYAPGGVAAATVTALAVGVTFLVLRRLANRRLAVTATAALALGTGVWSVSADSMWTHGVTHLTLMLGVLAAADARYARSGLAFAAAVLTRPHTAVVPAAVGIWQTVADRRWRPMLAMGTTSLVGVILLIAYSQWLFETWMPVAGYDTGRPGGVAQTPWLQTLERFAFTLGHPQRGVMIYTPALLVLVPFVRHGWRASPTWVRSSAAGGVLYLLVQLRVNTFDGGADFFGARLTLETLVLITPLLLRTWQTSVSQNPKLKGACVGLLVVGLLLHGYGALNPITNEARDAWQEQLDGLCEREPALSGC